MAQTEQTYDVKQVNHRLTMLLGIAAGQEGDIKAIKESQGIMKDRVERMAFRLDGVDQRLENVEQRVTQGFHDVGQRFDTLDKKFDQVLQQLATLAAKSKE